MRSAFRPLPLLAFAEALADHLIYRRFHKARADAFAVPVALAVIWNEATIVLNVGVKLLHESIQIWGQPRTSATIYFYIPLSFPSSSRRSAPVKIKVHLVIDDDDGHKETITDVGSVAKLLFRAFWRL
jgi:hypothetical protein